VKLRGKRYRGSISLALLKERRSFRSLSRVDPARLPTVFLISKSSRKVRGGVPDDLGRPLARSAHERPESRRSPRLASCSGDSRNRNCEAEVRSVACRSMMHENVIRSATTRLQSAGQFSRVEGADSPPSMGRVVSGYRVLAERLLATLSFSDPICARARSRKRHRLTDFQKRIFAERAANIARAPRRCETDKKAPLRNWMHATVSEPLPALRPARSVF